MEEDSTQSKQFTLIDLTTLALITAVIAVLSFRNWNLESAISQQKESQREEITLLKKTYESQISQLHKVVLAIAEFRLRILRDFVLGRSYVRDNRLE